MAALSKKQTYLGQRIQQVNAELSALRKEIRKTRRDIKRPAALIRRQEDLILTSDKKSSPAPGIDREGQSSGGLSSGVAPNSNGRERDTRFASYFITGSFHGMRPLPQEQRIVRNRAIFLIGLAIILLIGILLMFF